MVQNRKHPSLTAAGASGVCLHKSGLHSDSWGQLPWRRRHAPSPVTAGEEGRLAGRHYTGEGGACIFPYPSELPLHLFPALACCRRHSASQTTHAPTLGRAKRKSRCRPAPLLRRLTSQTCWPRLTSLMASKRHWRCKLRGQMRRLPSSAAPALSCEEGPPSLPCQQVLLQQCRPCPPPPLLCHALLSIIVALVWPSYGVLVPYPMNPFQLCSDPCVILCLISQVFPQQQDMQELCMLCVLFASTM